MNTLIFIAIYLAYTLIGFVIEVRLYGWSDISISRAFTYFYFWPILVLRKDRYKKLRKKRD